MSTKLSHKFADEFDGFIGFGLNRQSNEDTVVYYLQKFSDDELMATIRNRLTNTELKKIFNIISELLKTHLTKTEYHRLFLKKINSL